MVGFGRPSTEEEFSEVCYFGCIFLMKQLTGDFQILKHYVLDIGIHKVAETCNRCYI
jgi:hypothetical protein